MRDSPEINFLIFLYLWKIDRSTNYCKLPNPKEILGEKHLDEIAVFQWFGSVPEITLQYLLWVHLYSTHGSISKKLTFKYVCVSESKKCYFSEKFVFVWINDPCASWRLKYKDDCLHIPLSRSCADQKNIVFLCNSWSTRY